MVTVGVVASRGDPGGRRWSAGEEIVREGETRETDRGNRVSA